MSGAARYKVLLILALLAVSVILIAAALPRLSLQPGQPLPGPGYRLPIEAPAETPPAALMSTQAFFKAIIGILFILFLPLLVYGLVKKTPWRKILRDMTTIALITVVAIALLALLANSYGGTTAPVPEQAVKVPVLTAATTPLGSPPPWLIWLIFAGLAVVIGGLGVWVIFSTTQQTKKRDRVVEEAEKAVDALKAGMDFKNVIIRCYLQMSLALQQEQGIKRKEGMTTREFERLLESQGIPHDPVHGLTQLFEGVRYGRRQASHQDEQTAFDCLNAIIQHSRAEKQER